MKRSILIAAAAIAVLLPTSAASAQEGGRPIEVALTGAAERPGPGDPDGTGTASLRVNPGQGRICYTLTVAGIDPATAAHIHRAPPTAAGPVVVTLEPPTDGSSEGCATVEPAFRPGAVRGQLGR
jgi:hypothetical protein